MRWTAAASAALIVVAGFGFPRATPNPTQSPTAASVSPTKPAPRDLARSELAPSEVAPSELTGCLAVSAGFLRRFATGSASAAAIRASVPTQPGGAGAAGTVWLVSTPAGASWLTDADPTAADPRGLFLPLNDQARRLTSEGAEVPPDAPIFRGFTDASPAAVRSRTCAGH
jgi:hypothetical protein